MTATAGRKPNFQEIRRRCDGMMRPEVYERIYQTALQAEGDVFVEIGTAHGAATVCLAQALKDSGKKGQVFTFDRFQRGGREPYRRDDNFGVAQANIQHYNLQDYVTFIPGPIDETLSMMRPSDIGLLMLDCDGRIDRDLDYFFNGLLDNAPIIIDDYADRCRVNRKSGSVDQKHKLTYHLANLYEEFSMIVKDHVEYQTLFAHKVPGALGIITPCDEVMECYAKLIRSQGEWT